MTSLLPLLALLASHPPEPDPELQPLAVLGDQLKVGGYIRPMFALRRDTPFNPADGHGFEFQQVRLHVRGHHKVTEDMVARGILVGELRGGSYSAVDAVARLEWFDGKLGVDLGQFKVPFALAEVESTSTRQFALDTPVRRLSYGRDRGARLFGKWMLDEVWFAADFGVFNGEGVNVENIDDDYLFAGHVEVHPLGRVSKGEPDLDDSDFGFAVQGSFALNPTVARKDLGLGDAGGEELRWAAALLMKVRGFSLRGEFIKADFKGDLGEYGRYGVYAQAGYVLPLDFTPQLELVGRWTQMDINDVEDGVVGGAYTVSDNSEVRFVDFGVNAYFLRHSLRLQLMYRLTDFLEGPETDPEGNVLIGDQFFAVLQVGWL